MHAGNPALACTLCFYLPAKTNFVFDQQSDHFKIMRNISEQSNQYLLSQLSTVGQLVNVMKKASLLPMICSPLMKQ